jgi:phosphoglycolate phosphatase
VQRTGLGPISAVLTDFDRTLARLFPWPELERIVCADLLGYYGDLGVPIELFSRETDPYTLWARAYEWMREYLGPTRSEELNRQAAARLAAHEFEAAGSVRLIEGVEDALSWLSASAIPVVIVSSNSTRAIARALQVTGVARTVAGICGRADHFRMADLKPSTVPLDAALAASGSTPHHACFVGDSPTDMMAGRRAGIFTIGVVTGTTTAQELLGVGADLCIDAFPCLRQLRFS